MKIPSLFVTALCLLASTIYAQNRKGLIAVIDDSSSITGKTYAVIIGISDYQEEAIPDLKYADRDAEEFAKFLRSPAGGSVGEKELKVLTNKQATAGRVAAALDELIELTGPGDQVYIYFSGHGDVERKTMTQPGFLLCWDAPSKVYMGGGTFSLAFLQEIVNTLSVNNQAKVTVITDACHAGKLSGEQIGGSQLTAMNLAKQYANEIKILSCQPNEYSLEGEQWGDGRGCFSYHLIEGLYGFADRNQDGYVSLGELDRYLEDNVTAEAAPHSQVPVLIGNKTQHLAKVDAVTLANLVYLKKPGNDSLVAFTEPPPVSSDIITAEQTFVEVPQAAPDKQSYIEEPAIKSEDPESDFKPAISETIDLIGMDNTEKESPTEVEIVMGSAAEKTKTKTAVEKATTAEKYLSQLLQTDNLPMPMGELKREYVATFLDDAQQAMNNWLKTDLQQLFESKKTINDKYNFYPKYLEMAARLVGEQHYLYADIMARMHFFRGYLLASSGKSYNPKLAKEALMEFRNALKWQAELPQAYWQMSQVFGYNLLQRDSAIHYAELATKLLPNWILPYTSLAFMLSEFYSEPYKARTYLEKANRIDSNSILAILNWGVYFDSLKKYGESERQYKKIISMDSSQIYAYNNLGLVYLYTNKFDEAERCFQKALGLDPSNALVQCNLGVLNRYIQRYEESEKYLFEALRLDSTNGYIFECFYELYKTTQQYQDAEKMGIKFTRNDPANPRAYIMLAWFYQYTGQLDKAETEFRKAIEIAPEETFPYHNLGDFYLMSRSYEEAKKQFNIAIRKNDKDAYAYGGLAYVYLHTRRFSESNRYFKKTIELNPQSGLVWYDYACGLSIQNLTKEAFESLEKALDLGYYNFNWLQKDESLNNLRMQKERWDKLMKKYFAEHF